MVSLADVLSGIVCVRVGAAGAEAAGGIEDLGGGKVRVRVGLDGKEEDVDDLIDEADRDGPRWEATTADRFVRLTKRLNSYLSRMNFSTSLSRSTSIIFVGGGLRTSSGLYISLDLIFPTCRMFSTCSFVQRSIVRLFTFVIWVPIFR